MILEYFSLCKTTHSSDKIKKNTFLVRLKNEKEAIINNEGWPRMEEWKMHVNHCQEMDKSCHSSSLKNITEILHIIELHVVTTIT